MTRVAILDNDAYARAAVASIGLATAGVPIAYNEAAQVLCDIPVVGWIDGDVIHWRAGDVRGLISGPYARPGWASRCLDPGTGLWETFRLSRRAARRQRGRARAAARAVVRRAIGVGPSSPLLRRG